MAALPFYLTFVRFARVEVQARELESASEEGRLAKVIDSERLERCEREIADALAASQDERPPKERLGILFWEMDWRAERESVVEEGGKRKGEKDGLPVEQA